ncbi:hypothetical protein C8R47DRAFT_1197801 [Mycena vitilis]|nr:hypothetical protein C8R47DRAFT_1197801 [Mycena vitilis]
MAYGLNMSELRLHARISTRSYAESPMRDLWTFDFTDATEHQVSTELEYMQQMKCFWRSESGLQVPEEWTRSILPPEETSEMPWLLDLWFPLSLISAILCPVSSRLHPVPSAVLMRRSMSEYSGPQFPVRTPPTPSDSIFIQAMVNLLLCKDPDTAVHCMAALLDRASGCQLKLQPDVRISNHGAYDCSSIPLGFALVPEWTPTTKSMIERSRKAPVCLLSPAIAIGIQLESNSSSKCLTAKELLQVAGVAQPHLEAIIVARSQRLSGPLRGSVTSEGPPATDCVFVLALRDETVFIVAHIAYLQQSTYRYRSLVVDQLPFPPYVSGDKEGVLARLRIIVALLTIRTHIGRVASLWDDVVWPRDVFDAESALLRECTGIVTPSPSEQESEGPEGYWYVSGDMHSLSSGDESGDEDRTLASGDEDRGAEITASKELVDHWLLCIREVETFEPAVCEL